MKMPLIIIAFLSLGLYANCLDEASKNVDFPIDEKVKNIMATSGLNSLTILIADKDQVLSLKHFGEASSLKNTYDLASLTKVFTATAIMKLIEMKKIKLDSKLNSLLSPIYPKELSVQDLLRHTSGFKAGLLPSEQNERTLLRVTPSRTYGKFKYSDINYLLLGKVVEKYSGLSLDKFISKNIFDSLKMQDSSFNPTNKSAIHPTDLKKEAGVVHDPTSKNFNGVAGHAGIFSSAKNLAKFASIFLNKGRFCDQEILSQETIQQMTKFDIKSRRGLGFDILSAYSNKPRANFFTPKQSFGHTGFTGTSLWIDPIKNRVAIFLSNATYSNDLKKTKAAFYQIVRVVTKQTKSL